MNPIDDPLEQRRRAVAAEEAQALRAEVVRWVRDGEAGEAAAEVVRELVRDGLAEQVELALNSRDLARSLGEALRNDLAGRLADDLRAAVVAEVRRALAEGVLDDDALRKLRHELREEVHAAVAGRARGAGATGAGFAPRGGGRWLLGATAALFAVALGLFAGVWWMSRGPAGGAPPDVATPPSASDGAARRAAADPPAAGAAAPHRFLAVWQRQVATALPAGIEVGGDELDCWFPEERRGDLERLTAGARDSGTSIETPLRSAFPTCTSNYAPGRGASTVVFAAQAAARRALERHAEGDWAGCAARPEPPPDVASFVVDGLAGPGTYRSLNGYLACRGLGAAVAIGNGSHVADYLFVTYLALDELAAR